MYKKTINPSVIGMVALMISQGAHALDPVNQVAPTTTPNGSFYRQLDELRSQNAILTEALKNADLKNKISNAASNPSGQPGQAGTAGGGSAGLPTQVLMVSSGVGTQLVAEISLSGGGRVNVRVGDTVVGLGVVKSIARDKVVVGNKAETISLPFAGDVSYPPIGVR